MASSYWGVELLLDCRSGDLQAVSSFETIKEFAKELVERIDMEAFGEPWAVRFATHDPEKSGITLFQPITTSSITCHFIDKSGDFYLNVHSCKWFDKDVVVEVVRNFFSPKIIKETLFYRQA